MGPLRTARFLIYATLLVLTASACREQLIPKTPDFTEYGWDLWVQGKYLEGIDQFNEALALDESYADTWNGLGWSFIELGMPDSSDIKFTRGFEQNDTSEVETEMLSGRAFARLANANFTLAIGDAKDALTRTPAWIFKRAPALTYEDLQLTVATGFFGLAEFDSSLVWAQKLDPTFVADMSTLAGRSKLADKLQNLAAGS